jgi:hypothetical protein
MEFFGGGGSQCAPPLRIQPCHGWARFRIRLSLSFDFSRAVFTRAKKVKKGEGEPGNEATNANGLCVQSARITLLLTEFATMMTMS